MLAVLAFIFLLLAALGVAAEAIEFWLLGLALWALHFAWDIYPWQKGQTS